MNDDIKIFQVLTTPDIASYNVLAATTTGNGASKIGIEDAGHNYSSTNVEDALIEIATNIDTIETNITDLTASEVDYVDTYESGFTDVQAIMDALIGFFLEISETVENKVDVGGDTMTGALEVPGITNTAFVKKPAKEVTDNYPIEPSTDYLVVCNSATPITVLLPSTQQGQEFKVKNIGVGTVTLGAAGTDTIDDETTQTLYTGDGVLVQTYASNKWVIT